VCVCVYVCVYVSVIFLICLSVHLSVNKSVYFMFFTCFLMKLQLHVNGKLNFSICSINLTDYPVFPCRQHSALDGAIMFSKAVQHRQAAIENELRLNCMVKLNKI